MLAARDTHHVYYDPADAHDWGLLGIGGDQGALWTVGSGLFMQEPTFFSDPYTLAGAWVLRSRHHLDADTTAIPCISGDVIGNDAVFPASACGLHRQTLRELTFTAANIGAQC